MSDEAKKPQWIVVWSAPYSDDLSWSEIFDTEEAARAALDSPDEAADSKAVLISGFNLTAEDRT
jgi:hypothetical protein